MVTRLTNVRLLFTLFALSVSCASVPKEADDPWFYDDAPRKRAPQQQPAITEAPAPIESCQRMRTVVSRNAAGEIDRLYFSVVRDGKPALMTFDTGSTDTKLTHDSTIHNGNISNAGSVQLFCEQTTLGSMPQSPLNSGGWRFQGLPVIGIIGVDIVDRGVLEVDAGHQFFELHPANWRPARGAWTHVPLWFTKGIMVSKAEIDGVSHWVWFDTAAWLTMVFDVNADMSPPVISTHDWLGNPISFKESDATMVLGDAPPRRVRLQKTRSFPVFEGWMRSTGIDGSIGLVSLATDHFVIDKANS